MYQFHSMEILHAFESMLIPAMPCAVLVTAAVIAVFVLETVADDMAIDEAMFIVVEPISISMFGCW